MIKTKIINTPKGRLLVVGGLPEDLKIQLSKDEALDGDNGNFVYTGKDGNPVFIKLLSGLWKLLGRLPEITEEQAKEVVDSDDDYGTTLFRNYKTTSMSYYDEQITAKESLLSLVASEVPLENAYGELDSALKYYEMDAWKYEEEKVFHNPVLFFEPAK